MFPYHVDPQKVVAVSPYCPYCRDLMIGHVTIFIYPHYGDPWKAAAMLPY